ncbi:MAG: ribosome biogenesis GTP-binding protein YihA/YsxC [Muribaculaceae bacterium]|nr:ribosome biogenesis GTP-binding protein YihA/YsxC [Muribaculaceae bacterium]MDE5857880.1 ribosome biogenesis GTP-binding protein YihA/YsxC [Muribaculaceae bacterium]
MIVNTARFVISNSDVTKCPTDNLHEYAFIGRSNVGKSSLINMLTNRKDLAKTSATPGKTLLINHFLINDSWYIVDLPGYGFARRNKEGRAEISRIIKSYILNRKQMTNLFLLIDSRHSPQKIDLEFMEWLGENEVPFSIVFTKLDKLTSSAAKKAIENYLSVLLEQWEALPPIFKTSSEDKRGREDLLSYIEEMNKLPLSDEE